MGFHMSYVLLFDKCLFDISWCELMGLWFDGVWASYDVENVDWTDWTMTWLSCKFRNWW
jgi:hypothetical protein